ERPPGERGPVTPGEPERQPSDRRSEDAEAQRDREGAEAIALLGRGSLEVLGLLPRASNFTFLARVRHDEDQMLAVYKPRSGEAPLWDFEEGTLAAREVAAYVVADGLGWPWVPPTVLRDGPQGPGWVQRFGAFDPSQHFLPLQRDHADEFRRIALFDVVANNADRKSGHCLLAEDGRIFVVDHGVTFHVEPKLRTVIWDFVDEPIPEPLLEDLRGLEPNLATGPFRERLQTLLTPPEIDATPRRGGAPPPGAPGRSASGSSPCSRPPRSTPPLGAWASSCARAGSPNPVPGGRTRGRSCEAPGGSRLTRFAPGPLFAGMTLPPFQRLLDEHRTDVYRSLVAAVGRQAADDCFQETFLSALRAYPRLRDASNLRGWLFTIATRKTLDHWRGERRRPQPVEAVPERAAPEPPDGDPELWSAVGSLPPTQRAAVI